MRQVEQWTTEEASEQTVVDLEQLHLVRCDSFPFGLSTVFPVKSDLAGGTRAERRRWPQHLVSRFASVRRRGFGDVHLVSILNLRPGYSPHQRLRCTCTSRNEIKPLPACGNHPIFCALSFESSDRSAAPLQTNKLVL